MPEMSLTKTGFTYSTFGLFTKNKKIIKKVEETKDSRCISQNVIDKARFQHEMTYVDFKDLNSSCW